MSNQPSNNQPSNEELIITPEWKQALSLMTDSPNPLFLTGKAGTGKTTLIQHYMHTTNQNCVVLAPTGVAAINAGGQTIHSFFGWPIGILEHELSYRPPGHFKRRLLEHLDAIIIDEISMVRADLLDCISTYLTLYGPCPGEPFGGIKLIMVGDLFQLPPVVSGKREEEIFTKYYKSPFFFSAHCWDEIDMDVIELTQIFRQEDQTFINILNAIRLGSRAVKFDHLKTLEDRVKEPETTQIRLTPTRKQSETLNQFELTNIKEEESIFQAITTEEFNRRHAPTDIELAIKPGARVMMLTNSQTKEWVNGSLGTIQSIHIGTESTDDRLTIQLDSGLSIRVYKNTWEDIRYELDDTGKITTRRRGSFTQFPIRLAWSTTIHKSQGLTFDNCHIDLGPYVFAAGQVYVAFSRCRSLEGLTLSRPLQLKDVKVNPEVVKFYKERIAK